jgi:branched-chain amino acid transport system substrate-binding protein
MASVGTYSGPAGTVFEPIVKGVQLWIKAVNAKGGVNGHQIRLIVFDDGGDPARHRAQVQDAVEHRGVIGFLTNADAVAGASSVDYLNAKRIPVVGNDPASDWMYSSPMYFLQSSAGDELSRAFALSIAQQVIPRGIRRFGTLICVEADQCTRADKVLAETAREAGLDVVYRGRASIAQPDFTAECLSARNENVEVFALGMDLNSVGRVTAACARQGYHPIYAPLVAHEGQKDNRELAGAVGFTPVFPYFQSGTLATDEFRAAVRDYGGGMALGVGSAVGWAGGKLMERAARTISEPPTTESLLAGLWTIKADTLGGLTPPLTFVKDEPPARLTCWFNLTLARQTWVSPDGFKMNCRDGPR